MGSSKSHSGNSNGGKGKGSLAICSGDMLINFEPTFAGVSFAESPQFKKASGGALLMLQFGIKIMRISSFY
ncbi:putative Fructokinase [Quillaja saponaria]|uniref:Fructokinase n=1 Tax=Quillaja saponaria TaxID=32244 RepID=A0AAD7L494_QUISA|nr:putative Fructokinase [Quillaja saponaria]